MYGSVRGVSGNRHSYRDFNVVFFEFEFSLYRFGGDRQFRVTAYPLGRPADGRAVYIKPAGHVASGDRQDLRGNIADQGASTCDLNAFSRPGQLLLFDAKITARSGDDRGRIDISRLHPHCVFINLTCVFQRFFDEFTAP